jgi:hypothetical protein
MQLRRPQFLGGVFFITFAVLVFQIVQTRILSVVAWYYVAFFAISVAMLGMTAGAVWIYLRSDRVSPDNLATWLSDTALLTALSMPASVAVQFSLITSLVPTVASLLSVALLMAVMAAPYAFAGITVSLALTRSPFPVGLVYAVDLVGAALGCAAVVGILEVLDGPTAVLAAGLAAAIAALSFAHAATSHERTILSQRSLWRTPLAGRDRARHRHPAQPRISLWPQAGDGEGCHRNGMAVANGTMELVLAHRRLPTHRRGAATLESVTDNARHAAGRAGLSQYRRRRRDDNAALRRHRRFN